MQSRLEIKEVVPLKIIKTDMGKIYCGDAVAGMEEILSKEKNSFNCIYADPDYNVGVAYNGKRHKMKDDLYQLWCTRWAQLAYDLLRDDGNLFIMNYPRNNALLWANCLGKLFEDRVHEYVWCYNTNIGHSLRRFTTAHRTILHCRKSAHNQWFKDNVAEKYLNPKDKRVKQNVANGSKGRMPYSWKVENLVKNVSKEKTEHACQIPQNLSSRLFKASTKPGDKVLIIFGGSGSEVISAIELGLQYTVFELEPRYCEIIKERALEAEKRIIKQNKSRHISDFTSDPPY